MLIHTFTIYWRRFVNEHNALGQRNQVIPNNTKTRKMKKHPYSHTSTHVNTSSAYINGGIIRRVR